MGAASPPIEMGDRIAIKIAVDGTEYDTHGVVSIETWSAANRIPRARIAILDGQGDTGGFPLRESRTFAPGATVEISAGYGSELSVIHKGTIVRHSIRVVPGAAAQLIVETADPLLAMTLARKSAISPNASDAEIIAALVSAHGGRMARNDADTARHESFVQYRTTDWDLMLLRAEAGGCIVLVDDAQVSVVAPDAGGEPILDIAYGESLIAFDASVDAAAEHLVRGRVRFQGSALARPATVLELTGLGDRFDGKAFVRGVHHAVRNGEWLTTAQLGMPGEALANPGQMSAPPAAGRAPPMRGLHTGQVKKVAVDPEGEFRVQVTLPATGSQEGVWARLGSFYASNAFGAGFFPEVGDEVILAFIDEDPSSPVILSSVYSSTRPPAYPPDEQNDRKAIVTRSKMEISFDDRDVILEVKTPGGRRLRLDDKAKEVLVEDPFGNSLSMTQAKVAIVSGAALELTSKTNMTIDCGAQLSVTAKAAYSLKAPTIEAAAAANLSLVSSGLGELKTSAVLTINGALVKIN